MNGVVLVPTYDDFRDMDALDAVAQAFPGYEVKGIPCQALIEQGGSLHCITMQLPKGSLAGMDDSDDPDVDEIDGEDEIGGDV